MRWRPSSQTQIEDRRGSGGGLGGLGMGGLGGGGGIPIPMGGGIGGIVLVVIIFIVVGVFASLIFIRNRWWHAIAFVILSLGPLGWLGRSLG